MLSLAERLSALSEKERRATLDLLSEEEAQQLLYDWKFWARPEQLPPENHLTGQKPIWLINAGRGFGKTRSSVEWLRSRVESGKAGRIHIVATDAGDARDVIVEGESGILLNSPSWFMPDYTPSLKRLTWPNGAQALIFSSEDPEELRGPQCDHFLADEAGKWKYPVQTWDQLMFGWRLGDEPRGCVATTPKPSPLIKSILTNPMVAITRGSTYDNMGNLSEIFINTVIKPYEGTRLGRQEIHAELLDDNPNALWLRTDIEQLRIAPNRMPRMQYIVVGVDPPASNSEDSAECGIVVCGLGEDDHGYLLGDYSTRGSPATWGRIAVNAYQKHQANVIAGEVNNGGDMVEHVIKSTDKTVAFQEVRATRGKAIRAEPVSTKYEKGECHHVGTYPQLEDQMCDFNPKDEDSRSLKDRMDAMVWAYTKCFERSRSPLIAPSGTTKTSNFRGR